MVKHHFFTANLGYKRFYSFQPKNKSESKKRKCVFLMFQMFASGVVSLSETKNSYKL